MSPVVDAVLGLSALPEETEHEERTLEQACDSVNVRMRVRNCPSKWKRDEGACRYCVAWIERRRREQGSRVSDRGWKIRSGITHSRVAGPVDAWPDSECVNKYK